MSLLGAVVEILITPAAAFTGTVLGSILRSLLRSRRQADLAGRETADELAMTGMLTSAMLAAIAAWLAGKGRTVTAFTGGVALGFVMGDRFERGLFAPSPPEAPTAPAV